MLVLQVVGAGLQLEARLRNGTSMLGVEATRTLSVTSGKYHQQIQVVIVNLVSSCQWFLGFENPDIEKSSYNI